MTAAHPHATFPCECPPPDEIDIPSDRHLTPVTRPSRHNNSNSFIPHQTRLQSHRHSFFPRTIPEWNALPETIIQALSPIPAPSTQVFKTALLFNYNNQHNPRTSLAFILVRVQPIPEWSWRVLSFQKWFFLKMDKMCHKFLLQLGLYSMWNSGGRDSHISEWQVPPRTSDIGVFRCKIKDYGVFQSVVKDLWNIRHQVDHRL